MAADKSTKEKLLSALNDIEVLSRLASWLIIYLFIYFIIVSIIVFNFSAKFASSIYHS